MGHRRLLPEEMYPAEDLRARARFVVLASGLRVRVVEAGDESAPHVLLIPGWGCGAWSFHEILPLLALAGFHAVAAELKGHGLSDKPRAETEYTLESMSSHVIEIIDALGFDRCRLMGHSMGGAIVARVAEMLPDRIESVVFVAPVGFRGVTGMRIFRAITPEFAVPALHVAARRIVVSLMLWIAWGRIGRYTSRDVDEYWAPTQFPDFTRALRHLLHAFTWNAPFPDLKVPWMMILGTRDHLSRAIDADRPGNEGVKGEMVVVKDAGHALVEEVSGIVGAATVKFFRQ